MIRIDARLPCGDGTLDVTWESHARVTGLFGPSGAGKTTILRALAGLVRPREGRIEAADATFFDSSRGIHVPPHRRGLGFVFQDCRLFPHLTVRENLAFGSPLGRAAARRDSEEVAGALDLEDLLHRRADSLSGGESRRVALGRALACRPRLLLLDEPLAGLDLPRRLRMLETMSRALSHFSIPAVYVSHTLPDFLALADVAVPVRAGHAGPAVAPARLLETLRGGEAWGAAEAVWHGTVRGAGSDDGLVLVEAGGTTLQAVCAPPPPPGTRVWIEIPARSVLLAAGEVPRCSARNRIRGRVTGIRPLGRHLLATLRTEAGLELHSEVSRSACRDLDLHEGADAVALFKASAIVLATALEDQVSPPRGDEPAPPA